MSTFIVKPQKTVVFTLESRGHKQTYLACVFFQIALLPSAEGGEKNGKNESAQQKEPTKKIKK